MKAQPCSTINKVVCVTINPAFSTVLMNFDRTLDSKNSKNSSEEDFHFINTSLFLSILNFKWWIHHESLQHGSIVQPARDRFLVRHRSADVAAVVSGLPVAHRTWHHLVLGVPRGSDLNPQNLFMTVGNSSIKNGIYTFIIYHISYYTYIYIIWYMYIWYELWKMRSSAFSSKDLVWWCVMFFQKTVHPYFIMGTLKVPKLSKPWTTMNTCWFWSIGLGAFEFSC